MRNRISTTGCTSNLVDFTSLRATRRSRALALSALAVITAACLYGFPREARAQTARDVCQRGFPAPTLCMRARLDTLRASYLVLIDESGSMRGRWPEVKGALSDFVSAIPDGDQLEIRAFAGSVRTLIPPTPASNRLRAGWVNQLASLPNPAGANTDLGLAAASINEQLRSVPADRLYFVFLMTDGQHDPQSPVPASGFPTS